MASGVTFAQLPEDAADFLAFLATTGDVWARAVDDDPRSPRWPPGPVAEFLDRYADAIRAFATAKQSQDARESRPCYVVQTYLGMKPAILQPPISEVTGRNGERYVDPGAGEVVWYTQGGFYSDSELAQSNFGYHTTFVEDGKWVKKAEAFLKWAKKVASWLRRRASAEVPVTFGPYPTRATGRVTAACRNGLKVGY